MVKRKIQHTRFIGKLAVHFVIFKINVWSNKKSMLDISVISGNRQTDSDENCEKGHEVRHWIGREMIYLKRPAIKDFYAISASPFFKHWHTDQETYFITEEPRTVRQQELCLT
jgi:hypothetical protein